MQQRREISLRDWPVGRPAVFIATHDGPALGRRLAQLGVRSGAIVTPVQRTPGGGLVVAVADLRLALDRSTVAAMRVDNGDPTAATERDST